MFQMHEATGRAVHHYAMTSPANTGGERSQLLGCSSAGTSEDAPRPVAVNVHPQVRDGIETLRSPHLARRPSTPHFATTSTVRLQRLHDRHVN